MTLIGRVTRRAKLDRRMLVLVSVLSSAAIADPALADSAVSESRTREGVQPTVFVLLIGHGEAPLASGLRPLGAVQDDVVRMAEFFRVLRPRRTVVHVRGSGAIWRGRIGEDVRPPTWSALEQTVVELARASAAADNPIVYIYYAGHGQRTVSDQRVRTRLFLEAEAQHDGVLDSQWIASKILKPLGSFASVHFIVDACQSYFLLETREVQQTKRIWKRHPGADAQVGRRFATEHPQVGMVLATNGSQVTYEDPTFGGLFSHALRSAALGAADLDEDGVVSYGELAFGISWVMAGRAGAASPGIIGPGGSSEAPFIDLRALPAGSPVHFGDTATRRYEVLTDERIPFATVYPMPGDTIHLENERTWFFVDQEGTSMNWWSLEHSSPGTEFTAARTADAYFAARSSGHHRFKGLYPVPMIDDLEEIDSEAVPPPWEPVPYWGVSAAAMVDDGLLGLNYSTGFIGAVRLGAGEFAWTVGLSATSGDGLGPSEQSFALDRYGIDTGYLHVAYQGRIEVGVGGTVGLDYLRLTDDYDRNVTQTLGGVTEAQGLLLIPLVAGSSVSLSVGLRLGTTAVYVSDEDGFDISPSGRLSVGFDWEFAR